MDQKLPRHLAVVSEVAPAPARAGSGASTARAAAARGSTEPGAKGFVEAQGEVYLQVGELAKLTGKTVRAIHLYEDMGLLRPSDRSKSRYRLFTADAVERVNWISKLQTLGFSLPEIQSVLRGHEGVASAKDAALALRDVYVQKLSEVQRKLAELHRLERELMSSLTYLGACQSACEASASVHSCPTCERHLDQIEAPPLVAGAFAQ